MDEYFKTGSAYVVIGALGFITGAIAMARYDKREMEKNNTRVVVVSEFLNWIAEAMDTLTPDEMMPIYLEKLEFLNITLEET